MAVSNDDGHYDVLEVHSSLNYFGERANKTGYLTLVDNGFYLAGGVLDKDTTSLSWGMASSMQGFEWPMWVEYYLNLTPWFRYEVQAAAQGRPPTFYVRLEDDNPQGDVAQIGLPVERQEWWVPRGARLDMAAGQIGDAGPLDDAIVEVRYECTGPDEVQQEGAADGRGRMTVNGVDYVQEMAWVVEK